MSTAGPPLERHRVFHSRDEEASRAFLATKELSLDLHKRDATPLEIHINGAYLSGGIYVGYFHYGRAAVVKGHFEVCPPMTVSTAAGEVECWIQLPLSKHAKISTGKHSFVSSPRRAIMFSPYFKTAIHSETGCERLGFAFVRGVLTRQLVALLGRPLDAPLRFAHEIDLTRGYGQGLARYLLLTLAELEQPDSLLRHPITLGTLEQFIITGLLLSHPHNYSAALQAPPQSIAPRDVKRAIDYIEAHLDAAITLADIVEAAGVAGRTLFKHFRDSTGASPIGYMRKARFRKVRAALLRAEPEDSVSQIAMRWGFNHMGRFAAEYRRHFGEDPSQTLRHGRKPS